MSHFDAGPNEQRTSKELVSKALDRLSKTYLAACVREPKNCGYVMGNVSVQDLVTLVNFATETLRAGNEPFPWHPIETAPQGDAIVWLPKRGSVVIGRLCGGLWYDLTTGWVCEPSHWMPLPPPPVPTKNSVAS